MNTKRHQHDSDNSEERKKKKKRDETAELCSVIDNEEVKKALKASWSQRAQYSSGGLELDCEPFPHCIIRNFLQSEAFTENLHRELLDLSFHEKSNDLYKFRQSDDLKKRKEPHIAGLRAALFGRFRAWLGEVLEVELETTVDISCAKYQYTDVLLCHDDELEGRRVAFILYLVPPWEGSDGGTLDLYSTDSLFQPQNIVKSLVPCWNTLVLFEVSPVSFHQVAEVLSEDKCRLSLSGWFHGPSLDRPPRYMELPIPRSPHLPRDETLLLEWLNPLYLDCVYQSQVQEEFEDSSEIQLKNFLKEEKFREVSEALQLAQIQWNKRGPPNKRCYEVALLDSLPPCVSACWELLSSEAFFLLLSNFTGLRLHYLSPSDEDNEEEEEEEEEENQEEENQEDEAVMRNRGATGSSGNGPTADENIKVKEISVPVCSGELRRWSHGSFTLLNDADAASAEYALDLLLPLGCSDWQPQCGGFTSYVANEEDEESMDVHSVKDVPWTGCAVLFLQSLCPSVNLLSLYKDPHGKFSVFKVIKLTLTDSVGGLVGYEILKLHDADPRLGVEVKFVDASVCRRFLESYSSGAVRQSLTQHSCRLLTSPLELEAETELRAGTHTLDHCSSLELCLQHIHQAQPERMRDDEVTALEQQLQNQALGHNPQQPVTQEVTSVPSNCFLFQKKIFEDRMLTPTDLQCFSSGVGRQWKHVGRALGKTCRALKGPAIDNLAYEYEREGLYEQAYQLLSRFLQAEGRAARLGRLIRALEDCKLTSLAENMLENEP